MVTKRLLIKPTIIENKLFLQSRMNPDQHSTLRNVQSSKFRILEMEWKENLKAFLEHTKGKEH